MNPQQSKPLEVTGRDDWIVAQALFVAIRSLRRQRQAPVSDIADMEAILLVRYPSFNDALQFKNDMKTARRLGWVPKPGINYTHADLRAWLDQTGHDYANVVSLFDPD